MKTKRYLQNDISNDALADRKMAFLSGPRQIGKTHLAKQCLKAEANYFNWDVTAFKKAWIRSPLKAIENIEAGPVVFDELHKYPQGKNMKLISVLSGKELHGCWWSANHAAQLFRSH